MLGIIANWSTFVVLTNTTIKYTVYDTDPNQQHSHLQADCSSYSHFNLIPPRCFWLAQVAEISSQAQCRTIPVMYLAQTYIPTCHDKTLNYTIYTMYCHQYTMYHSCWHLPIYQYSSGSISFQCCHLQGGDSRDGQKNNSAYLAEEQYPVHYWRNWSLLGCSPSYPLVVLQCDIWLWSRMIPTHFPPHVAGPHGHRGTSVLLGDDSGNCPRPNGWHAWAHGVSEMLGFDGFCIIWLSLKCWVLCIIWLSAHDSVRTPNTTMQILRIIKLFWQLWAGSSTEPMPEIWSCTLHVMPGTNNNIYEYCKLCTLLRSYRGPLATIWNCRHINGITLGENQMNGTPLRLSNRGPMSLYVLII